MEPAPELVSFVERMYRNFNALDANAMVDAFSRGPGSLAIGTDPDEWWEGFDTISAMVRVQFREIESVGKINFEIGQILAWKEGTVGWASARAETTIGGLAPIPMRMSFVVHEEGAYWRIVQWHVSIPTTNEDSLGVEMTTPVDELLMVVKDELPRDSAFAEDGSVTIVFTDIEGSTALMETLGEQAWLDLLRWHDGIVKQQTGVFGGSVVKGQGDGFMLVFPATGAAVACAGAIQRALLPGWSGVHVPVRMGLHCGNARAEGGDFFGRTFVVAARVAGAAAGGEILVSQAARESLGGAFPLERARSLALKGLAGQYAAFPVLWQWESRRSTAER